MHRRTHGLRQSAPAGFARTTDGFELAEADLRLPRGDVSGAGQSGTATCVSLSVRRDGCSSAAGEAEALLEQDPMLGAGLARALRAIRTGSSSGCALRCAR